MPRVTVILSSLNHGQFIAGAIQTVLDQTFTDFELFIVDDRAEKSLLLMRNYDHRIVGIRYRKRMRIAVGVKEIKMCHAKW